MDSGKLRPIDVYNAMSAGISKDDVILINQGQHEVRWS